LIIALALAGGAALGWGGTYLYFKPLVEARQSAPPVAGVTPPAQITTTVMPQQGQFKPAPQPPGEAPPGKVWSVEHGHWHDAPAAVTPLAPLTPPAPAAAAVTSDAATTPAPEAVPKKE
jgi:hypothetical protein